MSRLTQDIQIPPPSYSDIVRPPCPSPGHREEEEDEPTASDPMLRTSREEFRITENRLNDHVTNRANDNLNPSFYTSTSNDGNPLRGPVPYLFCHTCGSKQQIQLQAGAGNTFGQSPSVSIAFPTNEPSLFSLQPEQNTHGGSYHGLQPGYPPMAQVVSPPAPSVAPPQCNVAIQYNPTQPRPTGVQTVVNAEDEGTNNNQEKKNSVGCCVLCTGMVIIGIIVAFIVFTS